MNKLEHKCPICQVELRKNPRYPNYICIDCSNKASDISGRRLAFFNLSFSGGYGVSYLDTDEKYDSHICYIENVKCYADEARFGGIVIEKIID